MGHLTFLIDPPLLIIFGAVSFLIGEKLQNRTTLPIGRILAVFSLSVILFTSTALYLNMPFMDWFWTPFQPAASSGRNLMINSAIFSFESVDTAGLTDALAFVQILLYPIWLYVGIRLFLRMRK